MLSWDPEKRSSAEYMLNHPWLSMPAVYETRISQVDRETQLAKQKLAAEKGEPIDLD